MKKNKIEVFNTQETIIIALIATLFVIFSVVVFGSCDSGWSIAGWEIK